MFLYYFPQYIFYTPPPEQKAGLVEVPQQMLALMTKAWSADPDRRPSFTAITSFLHVLTNSSGDADDSSTNSAGR